MNRFLTANLSFLAKQNDIYYLYLKPLGLPEDFISDPVAQKIKNLNCTNEAESKNRMTKNAKLERCALVKSFNCNECDAEN